MGGDDELAALADQVVQAAQQHQLALGRQGGFGLVYRAQHTIWNQPAALKCFRGLSNTVPERREQLLHDFVQEGALLSELSARCAPPDFGAATGLAA